MWFFRIIFLFFIAKTLQELLEINYLNKKINVVLLHFANYEKAVNIEFEKIKNSQTIEEKLTKEKKYFEETFKKYKKKLRNWE